MNEFLIIARSARALAASAKRAGYKVHVIDCFADEDTRSLSESIKQIQYHCDGFDKESLITNTQEMVSRYPDIKLVLGSGFEIKPGQIDELSDVAPVLSNSKKTINCLKEPDSFYEILNKHDINYPEVSNLRPNDSTNWLVKKVAGIGGAHVQWVCNESVLNDNIRTYYQRYVSGRVLSVVFLANGKKAKIIGFNQQLQSDQFEDMPFLYKGAVTMNAVNDVHKHEVEEIINKITEESGLTGLCGLDYIVDDSGVVHVLEVNPRPPSTFELHESEASLFDAHIACFDGIIKNDNNFIDVIKGSAILYSVQDIRINKLIDWPDYVKDRPSLGTNIPARFPVCTVYAQENTIDKVKELLFNRLKQLETTIMSMQAAA